MLDRRLASLPRPNVGFASDNGAGAHPIALDAMQRANGGHVAAYGYDEYTKRADEAFNELFGTAVETFYTWSGTGANVFALANLIGVGDATICTDVAHINVDETGAPERLTGAKLIAVPSVNAKLTAAQITDLLGALGDEHHAQPAVVSITQSTEASTVYQADEVAAICDVAHRSGLVVHIDGARIANAAAAIGGTGDAGCAALRSFTVDAGVDVVSFGGTKNGMTHGEAVVFLNPACARRAKYVRKAMGQLPSKVRYIAAQFDVLLRSGQWLHNAAHANAMAQRLFDGLQTIVHVSTGAPPEANAVFARLHPAAIQALAAWIPFYVWDPAVHEVRWMAAWDTSTEDVDRFLAGIRAVVAEPLDAAI